MLSKPQTYQRRDDPEVWSVDQFDDDGGCYVTSFYGPESEARARAYARFLENIAGNDPAGPKIAHLLN